MPRAPFVRLIIALSASLTACGGSDARSGSGGAQGQGGAGSGGAQGQGGAGSGGAQGQGGAHGSGGAVGSGGVDAGAGSGGAGAGGARASGGASGNLGGTGGAAGAGGGSGASYDQMVLAEGPVAYWAMSKLSGSEPDLTGHNHDGTYRGGTTRAAALPNGDQAADFDGASQFVTVPSSAAFSIPTTGNLSWEGWIRPDVLQFPNDSGGYVDWMGKCADYSPSCEWEARMYSTTNSENRCNRLSAYVFNPTAGLGSAADWQPVCNLIQAGQWYHVVGEYTTQSQPASCQNAAAFPGSINIWVDGVLWSQASHGQTGCMSQYNVVPKANTSPLNIATMAEDAWFSGAIGKVAIYDFLLPAARITAHYRAMTGKAPTGTCGNTCSF